MPSTNGTTRNRVERALTGAPRSLGYRPRLAGCDFWDDGEGGPTYARMLRDVAPMLAHPRVVFALGTYKSGIGGMRVEFRASSPEVARFAESEWARFLQRCRVQAQRSYDYGRAGFEPVYDREGGYLRLGRLEDFHPLDVRALTLKGRPAGVRVHNVPGGSINLWGPGAGPVPDAPPKGVWFAHNRHYHRTYGWSQLYGAWKPWRRLAGRDGVEDVEDLGAYRHALPYLMIRAPLGDERHKAEGAGEQKTMDRATQIQESAKSGNGYVFPSEKYPQEEGGHYHWDMTAIEIKADLEQLGGLADRLEQKVSLGIGVPPEIYEAPDVGSGYSGRMVPLEGYYLGQQQNAEALFEQWKAQLGDPEVAWNFGPGAWFVGTVQPLLLTKLLAAAKAQKLTQGGGNGDGTGPQRPPPPGAGPVRLATAAAGGVYHGPRAPGPGWSLVSVGPRGGKVWGKGGRRDYTPAEHARWKTKEHVKRAAVASAKEAGHAAAGLHRASKDVAARVGRGVWDRLPPRAQWAMARTWKLAKAVEHKVMAGFHGARALAEAAGRERGLSPEQVARVGKILATADLVSAWTVNMPLVAVATGSLTAGKVASWVPVASLAYLTYSTARNPFATVRAARTAIRSLGKAHAAPAGVALSLPEEPTRQAAGRLSAGVQAHGDWYAALVSAALDRTKDLARALDLADRAVKQQPSDPAGGGAGKGPLELATAHAPAGGTRADVLRPESAEGEGEADAPPK